MGSWVTKEGLPGPLQTLKKTWVGSRHAGLQQTEPAKVGLVLQDRPLPVHGPMGFASSEKTALAVGTHSCD